MVKTRRYLLAWLLKLTGISNWSIENARNNPRFHIVVNPSRREPRAGGDDDRNIRGRHQRRGMVLWFRCAGQQRRKPRLVAARRGPRHVRSDRVEQSKHPV